MAETAFACVQKGTPHMYRPSDNSAAGKAVVFFLANPDEELLDTDVANKFNVGRASVEALLTAAIGAGYISKRTVGRGVKAYFAGPKIQLLATGTSTTASSQASDDDLVPPTTADIGMPAAQQAIDKARTTAPAAAAVPAPAPAPAPAQQSTTAVARPIVLRNSKRPPLDLAKLPIRTNVQPPHRISNIKGHSQWDPLFNVTLAAIGNSTVMPLEFDGALRKAVQKRVKEHEERYLIHKEGDDQVAIWRLPLTDPRGMGPKPAKVQ